MERKLVVKQGSTNWRDCETYFHKRPEYQYKPGTVSFALAWFQQGQVVRPIKDDIYEFPAEVDNRESLTWR